MANFIEVAGGGLIGGNSIAGLGTLSSAGVATAINLPKGEFYYAEETVTLTGSTSVTSVSYLIQPNSLLLCFGGQVTTAITGATAIIPVAADTGDTTNAVLGGTLTTYTVGANIAMGNPWLASNSDAQAGPFNATTSRVMLKFSGTASAGAIRIWAYGIKFSAPAA